MGSDPYCAITPTTARIMIAFTAIAINSPMIIRHVALNTGHVRDFRRDEVDPVVIAALRPLIAEACAGDTAQAVAIPAVTGYSFTARCAGRCMTASVYADGPPSERLCSIAVAGHSRCGAPAWRALHALGTETLASDPARVPPEPWCGLLLTASMTNHPDAETWLGEFERYLAWTYLTARENVIRRMDP